MIHSEKYPESLNESFAAKLAQFMFLYLCLYLFIFFIILYFGLTVKVVFGSY